jgi:hypothetical protein
MAAAAPPCPGVTGLVGVAATLLLPPTAQRGCHLTALTAAISSDALHRRRNHLSAGNGAAATAPLLHAPRHFPAATRLAETTTSGRGLTANSTKQRVHQCRPFRRTTHGPAS